MIQVAVMFPILLALTFGLINFILLVRDATIMESAARSAARELSTAKDINAAINKAENDLSMGLVKKAHVEIEGNNIVIRKPIRVNIPFVGQVTLDIERRSQFHQERESYYYNKPPNAQGSPIDGYSGYTGSPY